MKTLLTFILIMTAMCCYAQTPAKPVYGTTRTTFYDSKGKVEGRATTQVRTFDTRTTYYDAKGKPEGTAKTRTDTFGSKTTYYNTKGSTEAVTRTRSEVPQIVPPPLKDKEAKK